MLEICSRERLGISGIVPRHGGIKLLNAIAMGLSIIMQDVAVVPQRLNKVAGLSHRLTYLKAGDRISGLLLVARNHPVFGDLNSETIPAKGFRGRRSSTLVS
jgi:hypothetical protein